MQDHYLKIQALFIYEIRSILPSYLNEGYQYAGKFNSKI